LQVVQCAELAPVHNIWLDTSRFSAHLERHHDPLLEKVPQAEKDVDEA